MTFILNVANALHKARHATGGPDAIAPADIGADVAGAASAAQSAAASDATSKANAAQATGVAAAAAVTTTSIGAATTGSVTAAITTAGTNADTKIATQHTADNSTYATGGEVRSQVKTDGTDQTATLQGELNALNTAGGGTLVLPKGKVTLNGAIILPNDGASAPKQRPMRIRGQGAVYDGGWLSTFTEGGTILDLRYTGATPAKIVTYGAGTLELDHINFLSGGSDNDLFFKTTNTTVHIHHCAFYGNAANTGLTCVQDAIQLGGMTLPIGNGTDAPFQGYGSAVTDCYFSRIRQAVILGLYCNNAYIERLTASLTCGSPDGTHAFLHLTTAVTGNVIRALLIEANCYVYAIILDSALDNTIADVSIWDASLGSYLAGIHAAGTSTRNYFSCAMNGSSAPFVLEDAGSLNLNTILNPHQQPLFQYNVPLTFPGTIPGAGVEFWQGTNAAAARFRMTGQSDMLISRPSAGQLRFEGVVTSTDFRFVGQDILVGADTNYGQLGSLGGTTRVYLRAEGSATDLTLDLRAKGAGLIQLNSGLQINSAPATSATAGAATALPATPQGYFTVYDNGGVARKVPFYAA